MKTLFTISLVFLFGCQEQPTNSLFKNLIDKEDVVIQLAGYKLDSDPAEIGTLKNSKRLYISHDSITGWVSYPPLSAFGQAYANPPFRHLPDDITKLTKLQTLTLVGLDLVTLPDNFGRLENLDTLILFMNKLTISNELSKLSQLKRLKYIGLQGNNFTVNDLKELIKAIPGITTNPALR